MNPEITPLGKIAFILPLITVPNVTKFESPVYPVASAKLNAGVASVPFNVNVTPPTDIVFCPILPPWICAEPETTPSPVVLNTVLSTWISFAFAVIPSPPTTLIVLVDSIVPPPVKPVPSNTYWWGSMCSFYKVCSWIMVNSWWLTWTWYYSLPL